jgi:hypothetical protein
MFSGVMSRVIAKRLNAREVAPGTRLAKYAGRASLVVFAAAHLWASRFQMNADGISYLDIGDACFRGNWRAALNLHWSPLYPLVLGAARRVFPVPMKWEYPLVHAVNFVIFLLVIPCFEFFWGSAFRSDGNSAERLPSTEAAWWLIGYVMLAVTAQMQRAIEFVTPDLIVTGVLFLAAGMLMRVRSGKSPRDFLALGAILGLGYLAKAPMFPVAFFFFVAAAAGRTFNPRQLLRLGMMILSFALFSAPFMGLLSKHKGRFTFGESGKLNLAWNIDGTAPRYMFWEGGPPGSGMPVHPPRQIWRSPDVYEFASPIHTTYPLWYDPYYWHEGVRVYPDMHGFVRTSTQSLKVYLRFFFFEEYAPALTVLLFLAALRGDCLAIFRHLLRHWPLLLVVVCALGMFALILVEPRYVAGYLLLLWAPLFLATGAFTTSSTRFVRAAALALAIMALPMLRGGVIDESKLDAQQDNLNTAIAVLQSGIRPGDQIAYIGDGIRAVWAKLDRVTIVAEAPSHYWSANGEYRPVASSFWQSPEPEQAAICDALKRTDARAILAPTPSTGVPSGWQKVGRTNLCVKSLR